MRPAPVEGAGLFVSRGIAGALKLWVAGRVLESTEAEDIVSSMEGCFQGLTA